VEVFSCENVSQLNAGVRVDVLHWLVFIIEIVGSVQDKEIIVSIPVRVKGDLVF
jgi:hypothetical protein